MSMIKSFMETLLSIHPPFCFENVYRPVIAARLYWLIIHVY